MKTENTPENKVRLFALYYGQKVLQIKTSESPQLYVGFDDMQNNKVRDTDFLSLRSISSLTMEQAITFSKICRWERMPDKANDAIVYVIRSIRSYELESPGADYLRSIGILIPWMDLSVEDIKAYGWAKEVVHA